jgi:hypothetical protein
MPHPAMTGPEIGNCDHENCCDKTGSWNKRISGIFKGVKRMCDSVVPSPHRLVGRNIKPFVAECHL